MVKNVRNPVRIHVHHACRRQGSVFPVETAGLVRTVSSNVSSAFLAKYKAEFAQPANQPNGDPIAKTTARATVTFVVYTMGNASNVLGDFTVRTVKRGVPTASEAFVVQQLEPVILDAKRGITERIVKTLVHPIAKSVIDLEQNQLYLFYKKHLTQRICSDFQISLIDQIKKISNFLTLLNTFQNMQYNFLITAL